MSNDTIKILLLEDNPGDAELLETALHRVHLRYSIIRIPVLRDLQATLKSQNFDLLILDLNLPDSVGISTVRKAMDLAGRIPIVVMSGVEEEKTALEVIAMGAQDYVVKGEMDRWTLVRTIRHAIERKQAQDALQQVREELERKAKEREVLSAIEREQRRIGRDLHDSIQGSLTGIKMMLAVLKGVAGNPQAVSRQADEITHVVEETVRQTRSLAQSLCPTGLEGDGLVGALERLASTADHVYGVPCQFSYRGEPLNLDETLASNLYYISTEAINNAIKHARAGKIVIALESQKKQLWLRVEDNGVGMPAAPLAGGMGLRTMQHRAATIGAELTVSAGTGGGTAVTCHWPADGAKA